MNYQDALDYVKLMSQNKIIEGTRNIENLCSLLGNPQKNLKAIHIAGTNGKGSVGTFIENALLENGYTVGRYTSPSVLNYRDKLSYNKKWISEEEFALITLKVKEKLSKTSLKPSLFDLETAIAFSWLNQKNCDFVIIETGMGGKDDSTNIIPKILSVITPIDFDHTAFLGNTLEEIAKHKAGIITNYAVSAIQQQEVKNVLLKTGFEVTFCEKATSATYSLNKTKFLYKNNFYEITMLGKHQVDNAVLALETLFKLQTLGYKIKLDEFVLKNAKWQCRFDLVSKKPVVLIDGSHNIQGILALKENINLYLKNKKLTFVVGILKDKPYKEIAKLMSPLASKIYTISSNNPRALDSSLLADEFRKYNKNTFNLKNLKTALNKAKDDENIIIFGSLSFMENIYEIIQEELCKDIIKS